MTGIVLTKRLAKSGRCRLRNRCTTVPFHDPVLSTEAYEVGDAKVTCFVSTNYFAVYRWLLKNGTAIFKRVQSPYALVAVLDDQGSITVGGKEYPLKKGQHFILTTLADQWTIKGDMMIIAFEPGSDSLKA